MKNEFIPYEEALALKELGFNEDCFANWLEDELVPNYIDQKSLDSLSSASDCFYMLAPLYQQAFRWFREKYKMNICIQGFENNSYRYSYTYCIYNNIHQLQDYAFDVDTVNTYEEAELDCLRKLIEIVKEKQR